MFSAMSVVLRCVEQKTKCIKHSVFRLNFALIKYNCVASLRWVCRTQNHFLWNVLHSLFDGRYNTFKMDQYPYAICMKLMTVRLLWNILQWKWLSVQVFKCSWRDIETRMQIPFVMPRKRWICTVNFKLFGKRIYRLRKEFMQITEAI